MTLHSEIFEQPERLASLLENQKQTVLEIAKAIQSRNVGYAFLAARGTSDNAGRYANYLWGAHNQLPLALAQSPIKLPRQMPEWLTPLVSIIPAQLFACHLTQVKGYDTESPRNITKVTETH